MLLGIDLGTCNTLSATLNRDGSPVLIPDASNREILLTPSSVLIDDHLALAGHLAEMYDRIKPGRQISRFYKRKFGTADPVFFDAAGNGWFSETIAAIMLKKIKFDAEVFLADTPEQAVITVPAHYSNNQRRSILEAARLAGLTVSALLEEPVAAALSYFTQASADDEIVMVYDFGGGTFDLTLVTRSAGQVYVLAKDGLSSLGGREFDEIIARQLLKDSALSGSPGASFGDIPKTVLQMAEQIKQELCTSRNPYSKWLILQQAFEFNFSLSAFAGLSKEIIDTTQEIVNRCLRAVGISFTDIHKIILVGGSSQIPFIEQYWQEKTASTHIQVVTHQPLTSVAAGAAIYAGMSAGVLPGAGSAALQSVSSYNVAIQNRESGEKPDLLIQKNLPLPVMAKRLITLAQGQVIALDLQQYWDTAEGVFTAGIIKLGPYTQSMLLELQVENRVNGTLGLKLREAHTGKDLKLVFEKEPAKYSYQYEEQQRLLDSLVVNNTY